MISTPPPSQAATSTSNTCKTPTRTPTRITDHAIGPPVIAFSSVSKQYGGQILFVEASFQINPGEKVGLVGPNGAGKTTVFRLIAGEEQPDDGGIERPRRLTLGYFGQDVGEVRGRSILAETCAGAGEVAKLGEGLAPPTE